MALGGVFIDIFTRLNMASVDRVLKDVNTAMREGGKSSSRAFDEGFSLKGAMAQFGELSKASRTAYDEMARGLDNLRIQESRINDLRARNFKTSSDAMIAAQREFDAALANSIKLQEAADARAAKARAGVAGMDTAAWRRQVYDPAGGDDRGRRTVPAPLGRAGNIAGGIAALGTAGVLGEGTKYAAQEQANLNQILTRHQDTLQNVQVIQQGIHQVIRDTGIDPKEATAAAEAAEQAGYRGADVLKVVDTAARTANITGGTLKDTLAGLTTTMQDFGVKALAGNPEKATEFLQGMNDMAGKFVVTIANLKDINPAEYFKSLANIEPIAAEYMQNVPKIEATTQVDAIAAMMSQIGMPPERGMLNLAQGISKMGNAKGVTATALEQLGMKPEDIAVQMRDQGFIPVMQTLQGALAKKFDPATGMYNMGWKFNDAGQLKELQQMDIDQLGGMGDQGQAALQILQGEKFQAGTATNMDIKKEFAGAGITDPTITGAVRNWLKFQKTANGPSKGVQGGMMPELTEAQVISQIAGTGDVQRTVLGVQQNLPMLQNLQTQYSAQGTSQGFTDAYKQWQQALDPQIKLLGGQLKDFAETLGQKILPTLTNWVKDLNEFLDKFPGAAQGILVAMGGFATLWVGAKIAEIFSSLAGGFTMAGNAARAVGNLLMDMTGGSKLAKIAEGAQLLGTAETVAGTTLETGAATTVGTLEAGAATGGASIAAGAATLGAELAAITGPAILAALVAKFTINKINPGVNESAPPKGQRGWWDTVKSWMSNGEADEHHDRGGVVGFKTGGQPLMDVHDSGGDSVLGMLPNGQPVGLRGHEGILTPETTERLGGKRGIDALNAGEDPWADPFKVATTFYGSFAKGVAKYSKGAIGKALAGSSQTLDALQQAFDTSTQEHEGGGPRSMSGYIKQLLAEGADPSELGLTQGKRGGWQLPNGEYVGHGSNYGSGGRGDPGTMTAIRNAAAGAGLSQSDYNDLKWIISHESSFDPTVSNGGGHGAPSNNKAFGLGQFLGHMGDKYGAMGAYSGDPTQETLAMIQYTKDRYGGPAGAKAYWEAHGNYSRGGIVGYASGGVIHPTGPYGPSGPNPNDSGAGAPGFDNPNFPDWWKKALDVDGKIPIDNAWLPNNPITPGGVPPGDWFNRPSHLKGPNGIGGYSGGGVVGYNDGGVLSPFAGLSGSSGSGPSTGKGPTGAGGNPGQNAGEQLGAMFPGNPTLPHTSNYGRSPASPFAGVSGTGTAALGIPGGTGPRGGPGTFYPPGWPNQAAPSPQYVPGGTAGGPNANLNVAPSTEGRPGKETFAENPSRPGNSNNTGPGFGLTGGGLIGAAEQAATAAAGAASFGGGSQGAQIAFQLINRAIGYGGQLVGIGLEGLRETFLPHDSAMADNGIGAKLIGGIVGAHPSPKNMAGIADQMKAMQPKQGLDDAAAGGKQAGGPQVQINGDVHNHGQQEWNGMFKAMQQATFGGLPVGGQI